MQLFSYTIQIFSEHRYELWIKAIAYVYAFLWNDDFRWQNYLILSIQNNLKATVKRPSSADPSIQENLHLWSHDHIELSILGLWILQSLHAFFIRGEAPHDIHIGTRACCNTGYPSETLRLLQSRKNRLLIMYSPIAKLIWNLLFVQQLIKVKPMKTFNLCITGHLWGVLTSGFPHKGRPVIRNASRCNDVTMDDSPFWGRHTWLGSRPPVLGSPAWRHTAAPSWHIGLPRPSKLTDTPTASCVRSENTLKIHNNIVIIMNRNTNCGALSEKICKQEQYGDDYERTHHPQDTFDLNIPKTQAVV